jgi:SAM-dependent methyltransferase
MSRTSTLTPISPATRDRAYWNKGVSNVPMMTGAASVMNCSDLIDACRGLGVDLPMGDVLDVGCGTGRLAPFCQGYLGVDIAGDAVTYCHAQGVHARSIDGPSDLPAGPFDTICCFSVFTHINRADHVAYLAQFARRAPQLLVDIIPGDGCGTVVLWTARAEMFESDLRHAGYAVQATYDRTSPDGVTHRYYRAELS